MNPRMGPNIAPTRSKIAAMFVLSKVKIKITESKQIRVVKIFFELRFPFGSLTRKEKLSSPSKISIIVMMLKGTENRGFRATRNFSLCRNFSGE